MNLTHKALYARICSDVPMTITGLEKILFTVTDPDVSFRFWVDAQEELSKVEYEYIGNYTPLLFGLFLAMTDEEIQEIIAHYRQLYREIRNRHYQVNP